MTEFQKFFRKIKKLKITKKRTGDTEQCQQQMVSTVNPTLANIGVNIICVKGLIMLIKSKSINVHSYLTCQQLDRNGYQLPTRLTLAMA